jgi:predicted nucleotidyltransferase component of viral defense system
VTARPIKNLPASVRQRLLDLARSKGEAFHFIAEQYALERFLYRLGASAHAQNFLLKGALLFRLWYDQPHRRTRDADLLGCGPSDVASLEKVFREVCEVPAEDGIRFLQESVMGREIREGMSYPGIRLRFFADLDGAIIPVQFDVGFGDVVIPGPDEVRFPVLLDFPAPQLRVYPRYTVVAEKFEAMVRFGEENSRMKDYFDIFVLARTFDFDGRLLEKSIEATFQRRAVALPKDTLSAWQETFVSGRGAGVWRAFLRRSSMEKGAPDFREIVSFIKLFMEPVVQALRSERHFHAHWAPGGPWRSKAGLG